MHRLKSWIDLSGTREALINQRDQYQQGDELVTMHERRSILTRKTRSAKSIGTTMDQCYKEINISLENGQERLKEPSCRVEAFHVS